jgi:hypothetical protein
MSAENTHLGFAGRFEKLSRKTRQYPGQTPNSYRTAGKNGQVDDSSSA